MLLEIITDFGIYTAEIDPCEYIVDGDKGPTEDRLFDMARKDVSNGCSFYGWTPTDNPQSDPPKLFAIENRTHIISTKLYKQSDPPTQKSADEAPTLPTKGKAYNFEFVGEYLGAGLHVEGYAIRTDTIEYLLPRRVNGLIACEAMKAASLYQQVQMWKEAQGVATTEYQIIVPDIPLDCTDALEYLEDYVKEAEPQAAIHGSGGAKAWPGWSE